MGSNEWEDFGDESVKCFPFHIVVGESNQQPVQGTFPGLGSKCVLSRALIIGVH